MKKIILITLILFLFIGCSAVHAEGNTSDEIIAHDITDDNMGLEASQLSNPEDADDLISDESELEDSGEGEYVDASEAYDYLNAFRTEENVWYWNPDDTTQSHVNTNDTVWLKPLERDIDLENTAKIRAKELVELFAHSRPDGTWCFSIFPDGLMDYGENIAKGYENSFDVTEGWKETNETYQGQGHRRTMLHGDFNYVGIAGYKVNGTIYWVQNFGCRVNPKDIEYKFNIKNNTASPEFSIEVPKYASGNFELSINGNLIGAKAVTNGRADITVCGLKPGTYEAYLYYQGDYNCKAANMTYYITVPDYENPSTLTFNDLNTLIQMSGSEIKLENDYAFNSATDSLFVEGITLYNTVTIDGQGHVIDAGNLARIFKNYAYGVTFKNIRMINANTNFSKSYKRYFDDSSFGVTSIYYYINNRPIADGGAIYSKFYPISVINSTFTGNQAEKGGAIYSIDEVSVENSTFTKNSASDRGGAIYSLQNITAVNTNFKDNYALDVGGAVYSASSLDATNSVFENNNNIGIFTKDFISSDLSGEYMELFRNATKDYGIVTLNDDYDATGTVVISGSNVIIDANGYTIDAKNRSRLFYILGDNVTIKNITFINGNSTSEGGAIYANSTSLTIMDSTFENNLAQVGGVVYGNSTDIIISSSSFSNNQLKDFSGSEITEGGVICTRTGTVSISNSRFKNNTAYYGGVIHTDTGKITIKDSYFENNRALLYGGGITHTGANVTVSNSYFLNNYAERYGGSLFVYGNGTLYVEDSTFKNCSSNHYGGAISGATKTEIINCSFTDSFATDHGGAVASWENLTVIDSNFTQNTAGVGGAIFNYGEQNYTTIMRCNFINTTQRTNGALYLTCNALIMNSTFINSHTTDGTTGAIESHINLTVISSTFINCTAERSWGYSVGGAITNYGENLNVKDSTFENSYAMNGGAIATYSGNATVENSRFTNNSAIYGGGIYNHNKGSILKVSSSIFDANSADEGGAMIRGDADKCNFTKNSATYFASAMYGDSNTAKDCIFTENIDYNEGPVWEVATTDCTFRDNLLITKAGFEDVYVWESYYQNQTLYMGLRNYKDNSEITNETVTVRAYKENVLAGEFEFINDKGWTLNIQEGTYTFEFSIKNINYDVTPINKTITILKKEIADVLIEINNGTYTNPTVVSITSNLNGTVSLYLNDAYLDSLYVVANKTAQRTYNYIQAGNYTLKVNIIPANYNFDSKTFTKNFTVYKKQPTISIDVEDITQNQYVTVNITTSEEGIVTVSVGDNTQTAYLYGNDKTQFNFGLLDSGTYTVTATFQGDENFADSNSSKTLRITSQILQDDIKITVPGNDSEDIEINLPGDAKGTVTLSIAGEIYETDLINGKATVKLPNLTGNNPYTITYSGDEKYAGFNMTGNLNKDSITYETFNDRPIIIEAGFNDYSLWPSYYQNETLYMGVIKYKDYSEITDAIVTVRAYKNNILADEFEYVSGEGWLVNIAEGNYTFEFSIKNKNYEVTPINKTITINKKEIADVLIEINNDTYTNPTAVNITSNLDGSVELYLNDAYIDYFNVVANKTAQRTYNYIQAGNYTFKVIMTPADYHFDSKKFTKNFTVYKKETTISIDVEDISQSQEVIVNVTASDSGTVTVSVGDNTQTAYLYGNDKTQFNFGALDSGTYTVTATFQGDENFASSNSSKTLRITSQILQDDIKITVPGNDSEDIVINLPGDAKGTVTLSIAGEIYETEVINGKATVKLPNLTGNKPYTITYSGDEKYAGFNMTGNLNKDSANVKVKPDCEIPPLDSGTGIVKLPSDAKGTVTLTIDGKTYEFEVQNGISYITLPDMKDGTYDYSITYSGDDKYLPVSQEYVLTVVNPVDPVITASNVKLTYNAGSYYTIKVYGTDGKPANTTVKITGKISKTITTANGVAKFKVTQVPGTYKITIAALGISVTKTITVKHLVTLKSVTVKKSAKKLVLQATLGKVNGKYLKSKKVTFKFNGKKYTVKTNSKGIAKVTIKKAVLKKLKVGKKVTYQATYLKDTVKKTVKVKR